MEDIMITFLRKFDDYPFKVKLNGKEYLIGKGEPEFAVDFTSINYGWMRP